MSVDYWSCIGIGIRCSDIKELLDTEKCRVAVSADIMKNIDPEEFDLDDYLYGEPYYNLGDFLTLRDDTDTITYGDNGQGESYFFYPPSYPWGMRDNEPKSIEEVFQRIINAIQKVSNLTTEQIEELIEHIDEVGFG